MIPPIFHQTWKSSEIPEEWQVAYDSCQKVMSSYTRRLWTDSEMESFVKRNFPDMYDLYMSYPHHIQRCDSFRYMLMYHTGGIYLDLDTVCRQSVEALRSFDVVFAKSPNVNKYVTNSLLMSVPGHPFFKYVIEKLKENKDKYSLFGKHFHVMNSTGPVFFTRVYDAYTKQYGPIPNSYMLSKEEFSGDCSVCADTCTGGKMFTHVTGRSWNSWDSKVLNALMCHWKLVLTLLIILTVSLYVVYKRKTRLRMY